MGGLAVLLVLAALPARADLLADRLRLSMYGRMGLAWTPQGDFIQGKRLNLTGGPLGGRLEEGDYLEPTVALHLIPPPQDLDDPFVRLVMTPALLSGNGLIMSAFSSDFARTLRIELFQAYVEAGNFWLPDLKVWAGARFYRGTDVHISDFYYFNNLTGQGAGVQYRKLDVAVLLRTSEATALYNVDLDGDGKGETRRQRTLFVGQYVHEFNERFEAHLLAELHLLPASSARLADGSPARPADFGWVLGIKGRLDLGARGFNELAVRYGRGIANGGAGGGQTWSTFGEPNAQWRYDGAVGVEVVEHLLIDLGPRYSFNAYGILHYGRGASFQPRDETLDFAVGARGTWYLTKIFHLIQEASFQGLTVGEGPLSTAVKLTLMPALVPTGELSVFARPHFRLFYTLAFYDRDAVNGLVSPYLQTVGATRIGQYLGAQVEWWF
ncbi:carbohydrate porin [Archangium gephyra]|uniref:carbohydrate porin n=1 Tax=Archangium gephyra TaxID=48 RepID=UPI0035D3F3B1